MNERAIKIIQEVCSYLDGSSGSTNWRSYCSKRLTKAEALLQTHADYDAETARADRAEAHPVVESAFEKPVHGIIAEVGNVAYSTTPEPAGAVVEEVVMKDRNK